MHDGQLNPNRSAAIVHTLCWSAIVLAYLGLVCAWGFIEFEAKKLPAGWSAALGESTYADIHKKLGPPQDNMSAKGYQLWVEHHRWGRKVLQVLSRDCQPGSKPALIQYTVYVDGRYRPVYSEYIYGE